MKTVPEIIEEYSKQGFYIEILADGFKHDSLCWRAYVHYLDDGAWIEDEDLGCFIEWEKAFNYCVKYIMFAP